MAFQKSYGYRAPVYWKRVPESQKISPTEEQKVVIYELEEWIFSRSNPCLVAMVNGGAGTGKSATNAFLISRIAESYGSYSQGLDFLNNQLILCAPTHKACREAEGKMQAFGIDKEFVTLARLLGLREHICDRTGKKTFTQQAEVELPPSTRLIVVDEISMVSQYLYDRLLEAISDLNEVRALLYGAPPAKLLLVGDHRQLTPVNEPLCSAFRDDDILSFQLEQIVRHTGPILDQSLRTRAVESCRPTFKTIGDGSEVWATGSQSKFELEFVKRLKQAHENGEPAGNVVALASSNKRVNELCELGRKAIYGPHAKPFELRELLVSTDVIKKPGSSAILCHSTTYLDVLQVEQEIVLFDYLWSIADELQERGYTEPWKQPFRAWTISAQKIHSNQVEPIRFTTIDKDSLAAFKQLHEAVKAVAKDQKSKEERRRIFRDYYYKMESDNAPVRSAMALTIHRSQGSTIENVFVDFADIDSFRQNRRNSKSWNRSSYTAVTRASKFLGIYEPRIRR